MHEPLHRHWKWWMATSSHTVCSIRLEPVELITLTTVRGAYKLWKLSLYTFVVPWHLYCKPRYPNQQGTQTPSVSCKTLHKCLGFRTRGMMITISRMFVCIYKCVTWHPVLTLFQKHTGPWSYWRTTTRNWPNLKTNSCGWPSSALSVSSSLAYSKHYSVSTYDTQVWHRLSQGEGVLIALCSVY